ncbi:cholesterol oxidase substrate-binding domain-containing protein [Streptacidiphilus jiangxiensis]|uniref:FAD binding domain-containing protein n=1 Tax=Streptacidiphilus jiangxiensis TaxID=235985 RepID=A0A1H7QHD2_STRJI|nr:cholesterol oxidase substrate-binding domain-containing protein [Streptacidiphilus jiangxiensis]SEL47346.1 FAD binding domain-containing protein [Streptacidiphilus jiangxiensis]
MGQVRNDSDHPDSPTLSRRALLGAGAAALAATAAQWTPLGRIAAASAATTIPAPPQFPAGIALYQQTFQNWSEEVVVEGLWSASPASAADVVTLANWAHANGWRLRPRGGGYSWSPLVAPAGTPANVLLVDTTTHLTGISVNATGASSGQASVTVQPGATMDNVLGTLKSAGLGLTGFPVLGAATVGGVLATGGRGTGVPAVGETRLPGHTYGSVSNLITSLTAVVWDPAQGAYALRTFQRTDSQIQALLVNLGRVLVTEATLRVGPDQRLRCQSWFNVAATDLFAPPASAGSKSLASYVDQCGRVVCIWFPFTSSPWLRLFTPTPNQPWVSRAVTGPYDFTFNDIVPKNVSDLLSQIVAGDAAATPQFTAAQMDAISAGLVATGTWDIWGWSSDVLLYVRPTTLRITSTCCNVVTTRANVQRVVSDFYAEYSAKLAAYAAQGLYPMNAPLEIRVTGLDQTGDCNVPGALGAQLSPLRPRTDHPEWDTAVWFDMTTVPITPGCHQFTGEMEAWFRSHYAGVGAVHHEWPKEWANSPSGAWTDTTAIGSAIPASFTDGQASGDGWNAAVATLTALDPGGVFGSPFLDQVLVPMA